MLFLCFKENLEIIFVNNLKFYLNMEINYILNAVLLDSYIKSCLFLEQVMFTHFLHLYFTGDRYLKPWIIPEPEVVFIPRARDDECLILASDGLWDIMTNEEACEVARKRILLWHKKHGAPPLVERGKEIDPAAQAAAEYLSMLALQKGSKDNISVIVVDLKAQRKFKSKS